MNSTMPAANPPSSMLAKSMPKIMRAPAATPETRCGRSARPSPPPI
jgi:hypothetical protein